MNGNATLCMSCKSWIVWGIKNARPHPFNAEFDDKGRAHQGNSHQETCPHIDNYLPKRLKTFKAQADRDTDDKRRWRNSCDPQFGAHHTVKLTLKRKRYRRMTSLKIRCGKFTRPMPCHKCGRLVIGGVDGHDAEIDWDRKLTKGMSHKITCPFSSYDSWLPPAVRMRLYNENYTEKWRISCRLDTNIFTSANKYNIPKNYLDAAIFYSPYPSITISIARKLTERGAPYQEYAPVELIEKIKGFAELGGLLLWFFVDDAVYNRIYEHLHSETAAIFGKPIFVLGFQIEPFSILPDNLTSDRNFLTSE